MGRSTRRARVGVVSGGAGGCVETRRGRPASIWIESGDGALTAALLNGSRSSSLFIRAEGRLMLSRSFTEGSSACASVAVIARAGSGGRLVSPVRTRPVLPRIAFVTLEGVGPTPFGNAVGSSSVLAFVSAFDSTGGVTAGGAGSVARAGSFAAATTADETPSFSLSPAREP